MVDSHALHRLLSTLTERGYSLTANRAPLDDWLRVHSQLMQQEAAFSDLALRAAEGEVSPEELDRARSALMGLRALCTSVYEQAVGKPQNARFLPS
jgi:hypothetical protein